MMIILYVVVGYLIYEFIWKKNSGRPIEKNDQAIELLNRRYVQGEIDEATYQRLKKTISE